MNSDFRDLLAALNEAEVDYFVVGGYAVIFYSRPRFTKGLDIWVKPDPANARRLMQAFAIFGMPLFNIEESDFAVPGTQYVMGVPPVAVDMLTSLGSLDFEACLANRVIGDSEGLRINYLGKVDLVAAKKMAGRPQDMVDLHNLVLSEES